MQVLSQAIQADLTSSFLTHHSHGSIIFIQLQQMSICETNPNNLYDNCDPQQVEPLFRRLNEIKLALLGLLETVTPFTESSSTDFISSLKQEIKLKNTLIDSVEIGMDETRLQELSAIWDVLPYFDHFKTENALS
ncbi:hypothetical protein BLNAU_4625 [Blattamonas nauphoetae]|uniref:Uncharacterized protein n=1 Tax=Blattamonas nauphoetae TaxID=2049346 RepID=A0ABQ9Y9H5_9EUKA|nr:hypothetical protein BLNAU_4625 [Blattamonas nauphoetae]